MSGNNIHDIVLFEAVREAHRLIDEHTSAPEAPPARRLVQPVAWLASLRGLFPANPSQPASYNDECAMIEC